MQEFERGKLSGECNQVKDFYRKFGKYYDQIYDSFYDYKKECDNIEEIFLKHSKESIKEVLDLGCGTGNLCMKFIDTGYYNITAVDHSKDMLNILRIKIKDKKIRLVLSEAGTFLKKIKPKKYDIVVISAALHHFPDYLAILKAVIAIKPKILYIVNSPLPYKQRKITILSKIFSMIGVIMYSTTSKNLY